MKRGTEEYRAYKRAHAKLYRERHRERHVVCSKRCTQELRLEVLAAYGGKCTCCGESREVFLCIDHINGDGAAQRRALHKVPPTDKRLVGGGERVWRWAKKNGYPTTLRVLCRNCNWAKERGVCPHKLEAEGAK